jgi:hypothetical protein
MRETQTLAKRECGPVDQLAIMRVVMFPVAWFVGSQCCPGGGVPICG